MASSAIRINRSLVAGLHHLLAAVESARRTDTVREARGAALRTGLRGDALGRVVAAAQPLAGLGELSLRDGHGLPQERDSAAAHPHGPWFRSAPQRGQSPAQSSRHWKYAGTASATSSRKAGRRSTWVARGARG